MCLYLLIKSQLNINRTYTTSKDVLIRQLNEVLGSKRSTIIAKLNDAMQEVLEKTSTSVNEINWRELSNKEIITFNIPDNRNFHTQVPYEVILSRKDATLMYIYICVARWAKFDKGYFKCPYTRWAKLLRCSERTAKSKIKEAIEKRIIYVNRGDYIEGGTTRQDINEYTIIPISKEQQTIASKVYEKANNSRYYDKMLGYDRTSLIERKGFAEYANQVEVATWAFMNKEDNFYPSDDHYYAVAIAKRRQKNHLLAPEETRLLEVAKRRIDVLSTNVRLKTIVDDKLQKAKKKVNQISNSDILFITYQEQINKKSKVTTSSVYGYEHTAQYIDELFED